LIATALSKIDSAAALAAQEDLLAPLKSAIIPYTRSRASGIPGAEKTMTVFIEASAAEVDGR